MLTWLGGNSHGSVTSATASVFTVKPRVWADGTNIQLWASPLPFHYKQLCVKTCLPQSTNCGGCIWATGVHLFRVQTVWFLCRTKKATSILHQPRVCELSLGTQKIPNKPQQIPLSSFTAQYFPLRYWQLRVLLLLGRNSLARIQAAGLRTSVIPIDVWNRSNQKAK